MTSPAVKLATPRETGLLMKGPLVLKTLRDEKTQTRRVVKGPANALPNDVRHLACPYGQPGDRLWVRETFGLSRDTGGDWLRFRAGGAPVRISSPGAPRFAFVDDGRRTWRPAIHMPRWACRLVLEITDVRVQRVQDISEEDAKAEGVEPEAVIRDAASGPMPSVSHRKGFEVLWDSINADRGFGWNANPWTWCLSFKRVTP